MDTTPTTQMPALKIRPAAPEDERTLLRLAALDSAPALRGTAIVVEVDGEILAALSLPDGRAIADPFRPTAELVELLRTRARVGAAGSESRRRRHSLRRPSPTVALAR